MNAVLGLLTLIGALTFGFAIVSLHGVPACGYFACLFGGFGVGIIAGLALYTTWTYIPPGEGNP